MSKEKKHTKVLARIRNIVFQYYYYIDDQLFIKLRGTIMLIKRCDYLSNRKRFPCLHSLI